MNRVYSYGCRPVSNVELVEAQMSAAHRYYNQLVEIEQRRMAREAEILPPMPKDVRPPLTEKQMADLTEARKTAHDELLAARAACGVFWGTYLIVEDAVAQAARERSARFRRWDGSGTIGVQIQGNLIVSSMIGGVDTRIRLESSGRYPVMSIRVGSEGRAPVWATFSVKLDRPLPPDARVTYVRVHRTRVGTHYKWHAQFVLSGENLGKRLPAPTLGTIAVDLGWRILGTEMRVAVAVDDAGLVTELRLPERLRQRLKKVEDLRSIRDKRTDAAMAELRTWRAANVAILPEWFRDATATLHAWRAAGKLAALTIRWRGERFPGDESAFAAAEAWRKQDKHLLEWEANQRENVLNARKNLYREWARTVARYKTVVLERFRLTRLVELPKEGETETAQATAARGNRFEAGVSTLRIAVKDAVARAGGEIVEVPAPGTTQTCAACGRPEPFDAAVNLRHRCAQCLAEWDQDENAARNMLRAAQRRGPSGDRSTGDSAADFAPAKKRLGPRRNRKSARSKGLAEDPGKANASG